MEIKRVEEIADQVNNIMGTDGVWGIMDRSVHLSRPEFEKTFSEFETVPHDDKYAKLIATHDGVKFFALAEYATDEKPPVRAIAPLES